MLSRAETPYLEEKKALAYNIEAEQALLGALFLNNHVFWNIEDIVGAEHFYDPLHGEIFDAIASEVRAGREVTPVTLKTRFQDAEITEYLSVPQYLGRLAGAAAMPFKASDYASEIRDLSLRRILLVIGQGLIEDAQTDYRNRAAQLIERAETRLFECAEHGHRKGFIHLSEALERAHDRVSRAYERGDGVSGIPTGIYRLDRDTGGLAPSNLIVLAGRPAMGKTALGLNIAMNVAREGTPVAFFSLEMSSDELADRAIGSDAGISATAMKRGLVDASGLETVGDTVRKLSDAPLYIDETGGATIDQIASRARRMVRTKGARLVIVDYLQIMRGMARSRFDSITEISNGLKTLAKELEVPVMALSQLNRANESRDDKRPQLADLRESGAIEQDADMVWFVHREEYYQQRKEPDPENLVEYTDWQAEMAKVRGKADIIIAKNRHGPCNIVRLNFDAARTRFDDGGQP